ncbi:MAG TPA: hypothetical protein VGO00_07120 [Kofleriaceae bacterium]|nr:hypothetical protein [Kofleriaceae bacterium]
MWTSLEALHGWAHGHIIRLAKGGTIQFRPRGHSMTGKVNGGQLCTFTHSASTCS